MRPRIKICGITSIKDMEAVANAGADAIGLVFYPPSRRFVSCQQAAEIVAAAPPFLSIIGLFVNAEDKFIEQVLSQVSLTTLQFHGEESYHQCSKWQRPWIKAARVQADFNYSRFIQQYTGLQQNQISDLKANDPQQNDPQQNDPQQNNQQQNKSLTPEDILFPPSALLFDAYVEAYGGQGTSFNWRAMPAVNYPWILSGGLNLNNINEALSLTRARAVDVSSGVESAPGIKDHNKVKEFIKAVSQFTTL